MFCISRCILRWGLISGLALGGVTLLIGPERVAAGLAHVRAKAQSVVDGAVDNPMALRRQLEELAGEYPDRIATVRGEIAEVEHQIGQFERDCEVSSRVVTMTTSDLGDLKALVERAETHVHASTGPVYIRFQGVRFDTDEAYGEAQRINHVRMTYQDRLASNEQQLHILGEQKARLFEIVNKLEDEYATFQTQMWQLDRQIDAIERNQRLIEMTEQLQATLDSYDRWGKVGNLKQLEAKLAELRTIQQAQLDQLSKSGIRHDYEKKARYELETGDTSDDPFGDVPQEPTDADESNESARSMAWSGPIIVE
ncbi:MAG: hypothetical protein ACYS0G_01515 [Planctomycetota bacterium]|jgi:phage shock protein A